MEEVPAAPVEEMEAPVPGMERVPEAIVMPAVSIELVDYPLSVAVGQDIKVSWNVSGGDKATHSAVHYGFESKPGTFTLDVGPAGAGYPSLTTEFASGEFALPKDFEAVFKADKAGKLYFRAHAIIGGMNYWTEEKSIEVKGVPGVEIIGIPGKVTLGDSFQVTWIVNGEGLKATHTALHYGMDSRPGTFGLDVGPAGAGYVSLTPEFVSGDYGLPMEFKSTVKAEQAGVLYIRAHAIIDGKNYWTAEKTVEVVRGPGIEITILPSSGSVGSEIKVSWRVFGEGASATHTAVHYSYESKPGTFGLDVGPAGAGYAFLTPQYASGSYALPMDFTVGFRPDAAGKIYLRAHAIIGGMNYWTDERVIQIGSGIYGGGGGY